jgi:hypothetical protein
MSITGSRQQPFKSVALVAIFGLIAMAVATQAEAACMDGLLQRAAPTKSSTHSNTTPLRPISAVYHPGAAAGHAVLKVADRDDRNDDDEASIVGLWEFQLDGAPPDFGTQAWHADGTELMFSAGRNPATGDVCQGVWRKIGPRTYSLNHLAMGWDIGEFGLRIHIHAVVTLNRAGDKYTGTYSAAAYLVSPANPFDESNPVGGGSGNITGTRVKPD